MILHAGLFEGDNSQGLAFQWPHIDLAVRPGNCNWHWNLRGALSNWAGNQGFVLDIFCSGAEQVGLLFQDLLCNIQIISFTK